MAHVAHDASPAARHHDRHRHRHLLSPSAADADVGYNPPVVYRRPLDRRAETSDVDVTRTRTAALASHRAPGAKVDVTIDPHTRARTLRGYDPATGAQLHGYAYDSRDDPTFAARREHSGHGGVRVQQRVVYYSSGAAPFTNAQQNQRQSPQPEYEHKQQHQQWEHPTAHESIPKHRGQPIVEEPDSDSDLDNHDHGHTPSGHRHSNPHRREPGRVPPLPKQPQRRWDAWDDMPIPPALGLFPSLFGADDPFFASPMLGSRGGTAVDPFAEMEARMAAMQSRMLGAMAGLCSPHVGLGNDPFGFEQPSQQRLLPQPQRSRYCVQ